MGIIRVTKSSCGQCCGNAWQATDTVPYVCLLMLRSASPMLSSSCSPILLVNPFNPALAQQNGDDYNDGGCSMRVSNTTSPAWEEIRNGPDPRLSISRAPTITDLAALLVGDQLPVCVCSLMHSRLVTDVESVIDRRST